MLPGIPLPFCTKAKTMEWLDNVHIKTLRQPPSTGTPITTPNSNHPDPALATSLSQLANALAAKNLERGDLDIEATINKEHKKFNRLPTANKNTLLLFQLQDGQDQCDIENIEPGENILTLVNQTSPIAIQTLLHLECARLGLMANFPLGLCTALKNGCLASSPRPSSLNNLCVCLCSPEGDGHSLSAEMSLRIQEQATHGKLTNEDAALLTGMKEFIHYDYASFLHMLKNMNLLCQFIGGGTVCPQWHGTSHYNTPHKMSTCTEKNL